MSQEQVASFASLARTNWATAAQVFADLPVRHELPAAGVHQGQVFVESTTGEFVARLLTRGYETTDVTALLPQLQMPTLVMHRSNDPMYSFRLAQTLAAAIPHARLLPLTQGIMSYLIAGRIDEVLDVLNEFIDDGAATVAQPAARSTQRAASDTAIVLFTDIADSTALTERLGDAAFRAASRALDTGIRSAMRDAAGTPVDGKVLGDGVMGVFSSASQAIAAARRCVELSLESDLQLHIGLHAGDVLHEQDNVYGGAVNIASRICALCEPGQILVSGTVRDLARTSAGVTFEDRGEHALKGIADPVRVFAVKVQ
jgi:class 3 adenylate cyclase